MDASKCQNIERANARDPGPLGDCLYYNADGAKPQARPFAGIEGEEAAGKKGVSQNSISLKDAQKLGRESVKGAALSPFRVQ